MGIRRLAGRIEILILPFRPPLSQVCCFVSVFSHDTGYNTGNLVSREWRIIGFRIIIYGAESHVSP